MWFRTAKCGTRSFLNFLRNNTKVGVHARDICFDESWKDYFKFTIVRNPWDRLLSTWRDKVENQWTKWSREGPKEYHKRRIWIYKKYQNKDFKFFVKNVIPSRERHTKLQINLFHADVNFIGRFENLQADFNIICDKIGIPQQNLPHKNKTKHKHYTEYYDDETREIVAKKYAKDIEHFGYKFGE